MAEKIPITNPAIHEYLERIRPASDDILREMEAEAKRRNFPCLGAQCARILHALVRISAARRVFEMGSGFGYTMYWMAQAMTDGGLVIGTEYDAENVNLAREFFRRGGVENRTDIREGDAIALLEAENEPFDLIFCDIDKTRYPDAFRLAKTRLKPGGLYIADNLLWSGRVVSDENDDPAMEGIREFTRLIHDDDTFFSVVIPIRDGMSISVKTGT